MITSVQAYRTPTGRGATCARRLGTNTLNLWRWRNGVRPNAEHLLALQDFARRLDLAHLLPTASVRRRS